MQPLLNQEKKKEPAHVGALYFFGKEWSFDLFLFWLIPQNILM